MISKISSEDELYPNYPELARDIVKAKHKEWEHELEPLYPLMERHRFFVIFEPAYTYVFDGSRQDEKPFAWAVLPKVDDRLTGKIFESFCHRQGELIARRFPGIGPGSFKDTPFANIKILELSPKLFLTNFFSRCILGYFNEMLPTNTAFDISIKGMPGKEYLGVTGEVLYDPVTNNFKVTDRPYSEVFEKQYNKCEMNYDPIRFLSRNPSDKEDTMTATELGLKKGTIVNHPKKGRGTVLNLIRSNDGVRVKFDSLKAPVYVYGKKLKELQIIEK